MTGNGFEKLLEKCDRYGIKASPYINHEIRKPEAYYIPDLNPDSALAHEIADDGYMLFYSLPPAQIEQAEPSVQAMQRELERMYYNEGGKNMAMIVDANAPTHSMALADRIFDHLKRCHHTGYFKTSGKNNETMWELPTEDLLHSFEQGLKKLNYSIVDVKKSEEENAQDQYIFLTAKGNDRVPTISLKNMEDKLYQKNWRLIPAFLKKLTDYIKENYMNNEEPELAAWGPTLEELANGLKKEDPYDSIGE